MKIIYIKILHETYLKKKNYSAKKWSITIKEKGLIEIST